ncbi:MAG: YitT family protein [Bacteroidales bacterium]|nr:YitT family protein [Bacteroidales bacterium]
MQARDYIAIVFGLFLYSFGLTAFILPEKIVMGGMAGLGSLLYYATGIPVAFTVYGINILLLLIAFKSVGRTFVIRTIFGASVLSFLIGVMQPLFEHPIVQAQPFMNVIIGAMLCGIGVGMVFIHNGSTGGTDIIAAMVSKKRNITIGRTMLYCDMIIISSSYLLFHSIEKIVFGLVALVIVSYICDMVINSNRRSVQFMIISKKYEEIATAINTDAQRGCTVLDATGWYTKQNIKILMVLARRVDSITIFRIIKSIDPDALISQGNVNSVYGNGFDQIK